MTRTPASGPAVTLPGAEGGEPPGREVDGAVALGREGRRLGLASVIHLSGQGLFSLLTFVWAVMVARALGVQGKGELSAILLMSTMICAVGLFGSGEALLFWTGRLGQPIARTLVRACVRQGIVVACAGAFIGWVAGTLGIAAFHGVAGWVLPAAGALAALMVYGRQVQVILIGLGRVVASSIAFVTQVVVSLVILAIQLHRGPPTIEGAFLAFAAGHLSTCAIGHLLIGGALGASHSRDPLPEGYWQYGARSFPGSVARFLNYRLDQAIIAVGVGASGLGLYGAAVNVAEVGGYATNSLAINALPTVSRHGDPRKVVADALRLAFLVGIVAVAVLALIGPILLTRLFGPEFQPSVRLLYVLLPGVLASGLGNVVSSLAAGMGYPSVGSWAACCGLVATAAGCAWAIPAYGIYGAAWVSTAAYSLTLLVAGAGLHIIVRREGVEPAR